MSDFDKLADDIQLYAGLSKQEATGFYTVHCPICKNMERKTGGYKFESDQIVYNCFRGSCDASCVLTKDERVSRKFRNLMDEIGVKIPISLLTKRSKILDVEDDDLFEKHYYKEIEPLEYLEPILESKKSWAEDWIDYFNERCCPLDDIYLCTKGKYAGAACLAMYYYDKLIGYEIITEDIYLHHTGGNEALIYIPEREVPRTVILVEGTLDAKCIPNSVAVLHSKISPRQAYFLRGKRVIVVPDKTSNNFLDQCFEYGWEYCVPDWDCHDVNAAVKKYGVIVTVKKIMAGATKNKRQALLASNLWSMNER